MSAREFSENIAETSLLCQSDIINVFRSITTQKNVSSFKSEPRISLTMECLFKRCETFAAGRGQVNGKEQNLSFSVSDDCSLSGVAMYLPVHNGSTKATIEIFEDDVKVHSTEVTLNFNGNKYEVVKIIKPIPLVKDKLYMISVLHFGQMVFWCTEFKDEVKCNGVTLFVPPYSKFSYLIPALELVIERF
ncbi:hypothetical protein DPMN_144791 [Dreissena polymorpha]|uniref:PHR domain-containing protein n=1 Tax=Dreissena polymorpha TaxID=45954 RepID=A0A9D4F5F8_DREPO|nr:hypothetical protein DPMN_144791 [Dreissena polymorpha]